VGHRWQRFLSEGAKFLTVGGLATLVSFLIFNGLVHGYVDGPGPMHDQPLVAFVLANLLGMVVSYRGSRSWAFRNREAVGVAGGRVAFLVINVASMIIPLACLAFTRYVLGRADPIADNIAANVVGLGLGTLARFWAIRTFIFVGPSRVEARELVRR
jgi:putative flippase GtrA